MDEPTFQPIGLTPGEPTGTQRRTGWIVVVAVFGIGIPLLPFLPLALSGIEYVLFDTSHVEDFFRTIGLHDALGKFYRAIFGVFT